MDFVMRYADSPSIYGFLIVRFIVWEYSIHVFLSSFMFWDINDDFCMYMLAGFKKML